MRIIEQPGVCGGRPSFEGTRLEPKDIFALPWSEVEQNWPYLSREDYVSSREFLSENPKWANPDDFEVSIVDMEIEPDNKYLKPAFWRGVETHPMIKLTLNKENDQVVKLGYNVFRDWNKEEWEYNNWLIRLTYHDVYSILCEMLNVWGDNSIHGIVDTEKKANHQFSLARGTGARVICPDQSYLKFELEDKYSPVRECPEDKDMWEVYMEPDILTVILAKAGGDDVLSKNLCPIKRNDSLFLDYRPIWIHGSRISFHNPHETVVGEDGEVKQQLCREEDSALKFFYAGAFDKAVARAKEFGDEPKNYSDLPK